MGGRVELEREVFPVGRCADRLLGLLLAQDGSTTRLCSTVLGRPLELTVHLQRPEPAALPALRAVLGTGPLLLRVTSLHAGGLVAMDNVALVALDAAPAELRAGLLAGTHPVGRLLDGLPVRRSPLPDEAWLVDVLARYSGGQRDGRASRTYQIALARGPLMVVHETYRAALAHAFCGGLPASPVRPA